MLLLAFLQLTIHDDPSPDPAETFSSKVTSEWQKRQVTDFARFSCRPFPDTIVRPVIFCHDSCLSVPCDSSVVLCKIFARLALTISSSSWLSSFSLVVNESNCSCSKYEPSSLAAKSFARSLLKRLDDFLRFGSLFCTSKRTRRTFRFFVGRHHKDLEL